MVEKHIMWAHTWTITKINATAKIYLKAWSEKAVFISWTWNLHDMHLCVFLSHLTKQPSYIKDNIIDSVVLWGINRQCWQMNKRFFVVALDESPFFCMSLDSKSYDKDPWGFLRGSWCPGAGPVPRSLKRSLFLFQNFRRLPWVYF